MKTKGQRIGEKKAYIKAEKYLSKRKYKCLHKGCENRAVKSHSQQKNGPLRAISENGKVFRLDDDLQRSLNVKADKLENRFALKGVGESSTFPGFCTEHESIFSIFEDNELIVGNEKQACALFYRTFAYEKARKRREYERWRFLQDELTSVFGDMRMLSLSPQIEEFRKHIRNTCNYHIDKLHEMMLADSYVNLSTRWIRIACNVNASCSSTINLHLDDYIPFAINNPESPIPTFSFNLIPSKDSTHIIVSWLSEFSEYAEWLVDAFESPDKLEHFVNRFCFCDSEDACISPKLWGEVRDMDEFVNNMRHVAQRGRLKNDAVPNLIKLST